MPYYCPNWADIFCLTSCGLCLDFFGWDGRWGWGPPGGSDPENNLDIIFHAFLGKVNEYGTWNGTH